MNEQYIQFYSVILDILSTCMVCAILPIINTYSYYMYMYCDNLLTEIGMLHTHV